MSLAKRTYTPKVKGCLERAKRRIHCDRNQPSCNKCVSRDLECSGFCIKFKFRENTTPEVLSKRRRITGSQGKASPKRCHSPKTDNYHHQSYVANKAPGSYEHADLCFVQEYDVWGRMSAHAPDRDAGELSDFQLPDHGAASNPSPGSCVYETPSQDYPEACSQVSSSSYDSSPPSFDLNSLTKSSQLCSASLRSDLQTESSYSSSISDLKSTCDSFSHGYAHDREIARSLRLADSESEYLLQYFGDYIAPEMVLIDGKSNRWKYLVLPIAMDDSLIMNAILTVSTFHLSGRSKMLEHKDPNELYLRTIYELRNRNLTTSDANSRQRVILAILILLICAMINGSSDFPMLFRTLDNALAVFNDEPVPETNEDINRFIQSQIRMMRIHATPLLNSTEGVRTIASPSNRHFATRQYYNDLYTTQDPAFDIVADLRQQSFDVYLDRILDKDKPLIPGSQVEKFINGLRNLWNSALGAQILTWSCIMVASESTEPGHKYFFESFLLWQYERNGFANNLRALDLLRKIWSKDSAKGWPGILLESRVFIF